jgi:uncharacterized SAM-binding protein YcdF (DUF218 family)
MLKSYTIRKKRLIRAFFVVVSVLLSAIAYSAGSIYIYGSSKSTIKADAAIVLGAAVWGNQPSPVFRERINHAIKLYKTGVVQSLIFTGGQGESNEPAEAIVAKQYAQSQGVPESAILTETQSRTTKQNLYYSKQVAATHQLSRFLIVSDPLHMKRSVLMGALSRNGCISLTNTDHPVSQFKEPVWVPRAGNVFLFCLPFL